MKEAVAQRPWLKWIVILIGWSLIAIFFGSRNIVNYTSRGLPIQWFFDVLAEMIYWYIWAPLTPVIFWFAGRFPIERKYWLSRGTLVVLFGLIIVLVQISLSIVTNLTIVPYLLDIPVSEIRERFGSVNRIILLESFTGFLTYTVVIGGYYAYDYYQKYQERDSKATQLEGMLAQAELQNLKMQMHPHFLFNTLHTISILINKDTEAANQILIRLSDLLRMTLENAGAQEVSLKEEMEFLEGYLEIEQIRFRDRLRVRVDIEADVLDAHVPSFILQPLVENAIRHGIAPKLNSGKIEIIVRRENKMLRLEVRDNGAGLESNGGGLLKEGIGLTNTRGRLAQLYGKNHHFQVRNVSGGGVLATIIIPFHKVKDNIIEDGK
jgi:sensor histidine kinase YesM